MLLSAARAEIDHYGTMAVCIALSRDQNLKSAQQLVLVRLRCSHARMLRVGELRRSWSVASLDAAEKAQRCDSSVASSLVDCNFECLLPTTGTVSWSGLCLLRAMYQARSTSSTASCSERTPCGPYGCTGLASFARPMPSSRCMMQVSGNVLGVCVWNSDGSL